MGHQAIDYRIKLADASALRTHLLRSAGDFIPPLHETVDVVTYAGKLHALSVTFEAWKGDELVGLVAAYLNDAALRAGFITNVSVVPEQVGRGIARELLDRCIAHARQLGFRELRLEVAAANARAISLYQRAGFGETGRREGTAVMVLKLDPE